jgi:Catalytic LigB subunit of aromatic ring-opening dioxygenase
MAEILGLGITHYPPLCLPDADMSGILRWTLNDPAIPAAAKDPQAWPAAMRAEWADDQGTRAAAAHRAALVAGLARVRARLDEFKPDVVLIWGDDQYENFREDVIPPFAILAYDDVELHPWAHAEQSSMMNGKVNVWNEDASFHVRLRGRRDIARQLTTDLIERGFDVAYAYKPLHHRSVAHAFTNAILYLDYARRGFDHPVVCFPLNCYGRRVVSCRGFMTRMGSAVDFDPPSPSPKRFMDLGAAVAQALKASPYRVALLASSSWSHAFLVDHTWRLRPDTANDRRLYDAMTAHDFAYWRSRTLADVEHAGQQEVLNWWALMGAMESLGTRLEWSEFVETGLFNSNKVFAVFEAR